METRELERIRFTTRHFNDLQGLRYGVPLGLIALGGGLVLLGWGGPRLLRVLGSAGALALIFGAPALLPSTPSAPSSSRRSSPTRGSIRSRSTARPAPSRGWRCTQQVTPIARTFLVTGDPGGDRLRVLPGAPAQFRGPGERSAGSAPTDPGRNRDPQYAPPLHEPMGLPDRRPDPVAVHAARRLRADPVPPVRLLLPEPLDLARTPPVAESSLAAGVPAAEPRRSRNLPGLPRSPGWSDPAVPRPPPSGAGLSRDWPCSSAAP